MDAIRWGETWTVWIPNVFRVGMLQHGHVVGCNLSLKGCIRQFQFSRMCVEALLVNPVESDSEWIVAENYNGVGRDVDVRSWMMVCCPFYGCI